jgi:hypothetical protein
VLKSDIINILRALGNRLERAKGAGFELTFGKSVDQIEEIFPISKTTPQDRQRIENVSELSLLPPPYIVSQAWLRLEHAIREAIDPDELARRLGVDYLRFANSKGIITDDELPALQTLQELRNRAAHSADPGIAITDALRYHDIADAVIEKIKHRPVKESK